MSSFSIPDIQMLPEILSTWFLFYFFEQWSSLAPLWSSELVASKEFTFKWKQSWMTASIWGGEYHFLWLRGGFQSQISYFIYDRYHGDKNKQT